MTQRVLKIAIACLYSETGQILVVRKRGTHFFMLPGGKTEPGETALMTLKRELQEELGLAIDDADLEFLGHFQAPAANEPGHWVEADVFVAQLTQTPRIQAEIEEMDWLAVESDKLDRLAPLLREKVLPVLRTRQAAPTR